MIELVFSWNNPTFQNTLSRLEKPLALFLLPLVILNSKKEINLPFILKNYVRLSTLIILFFIIRFPFIDYLSFQKYIANKDLWEMGYKIADSIGIHAPALNMHITFITAIHFYLLLKSKMQKKAFINLFFFVFSFTSILIINTRLAIIITSICLIYLLYSHFKKLKTGLKKVIIISSLSTLITFLIIFIFTLKFSYYTEKFTSVAFKDIDKIGRIDEVTNPDNLHNALVTRISIWKSALDLGLKKPFVGHGSYQAKNILTNYYLKTDQIFLYTYKFPAHNQFLDFFIKFGLLGFLTVSLFIGYFLFIGIKYKNPLAICFFLLFFSSNLVDDFLIRFDGIIFSGVWLCLFLKNKFSTLI